MDTKNVTVTLDLKVPVESWIDMLTKHSDIFGTPYHCGYWLRGAEHDASLGWLCEEEEESHVDAPIAAWRAGEELPKGWHRLDEAAAVKAFVEGVKLWGVDWMDGDHNDGHGYDTVVQMALLGEVRYG